MDQLTLSYFTDTKRPLAVLYRNRYQLASILMAFGKIELITEIKSEAGLFGNYSFDNATGTVIDFDTFMTVVDSRIPIDISPDDNNVIN